MDSYDWFSRASTTQTELNVNRRGIPRMVCINSLIGIGISSAFRIYSNNIYRNDAIRGKCLVADLCRMRSGMYIKDYRMVNEVTSIAFLFWNTYTLLTALRYRHKYKTERDTLSSYSKKALAKQT